jgi:hypothetical protein
MPFFIKRSDIAYDKFILKFIDQSTVVCSDMNIFYNVEGSEFPVLCMVLFRCMNILQDMEDTQFHWFSFVTGCDNIGVLCVKRDHKSKSWS